MVSLAMVGGDTALSGALAEGLRLAGAAVVAIGVADGVACDLTSADAVAACLAAAEASFDSPPAVIRLGIRRVQSVPIDVATMTLDEWAALAEAPLREAFAFHQAAQRFFGDRPGRVLVVVPTVGLSGAPGLVPLATTAEADRSLVKAQARVSGQRGVTINCIAADSALLASSDTDLDRGGLPVRALSTPDVSQLAGVILGLLGPGFDAVTGQTIAVDGGRWMTP
jgi:3-oxoacyl-[acyl-carrier protein] reductase